MNESNSIEFTYVPPGDPAFLRFDVDGWMRAIIDTYSNLNPIDVISSLGLSQRDLELGSFNMALTKPENYTAQIGRLNSALRQIRNANLILIQNTKKHEFLTIKSELAQTANSLEFELEQRKRRWGRETRGNRDYLANFVVELTLAVWLKNFQREPTFGVSGGELGTLPSTPFSKLSMLALKGAGIKSDWRRPTKLVVENYKTHKRRSKNA